MAKVVHTIKNNDYIYEHYRDKNQGGKVVSKYRGRADALGVNTELQGEPRTVVMQPTGQPEVPQVNWNTSIHEGQIVYMSPEEYMERVNIFNRYSESEVLRKEVRAENSGLRGIGYYPPLSESSYISLMKAMQDGNAIDIPNLVYKDGYLDNQEGFHRSLVARDLGLKEIPVHVIGEMPESFKKADIRRNANLLEQKEAINQLRGKHINLSKTSYPDTEKKEWVLYHGTGLNEADQIMRQGLRPQRQPIFLTADIKTAERFASTKRGYKSSEDITPREGVILEITLNEEDFEEQLRQGTDPRIVKTRRDNLEKTVNKTDVLGGFEYEWYRNIPPERIKVVKEI